MMDNLAQNLDGLQLEEAAGSRPGSGKGSKAKKNKFRGDKKEGKSEDKVGKGGNSGEGRRQRSPNSQRRQALQQQPLRLAPHDPSLSLSDPGNLHPKRKSTKKTSSGPQSEKSFTPPLSHYHHHRRKSDSNAPFHRDSMRSPLPAQLKSQHLAHKCCWSDNGSVSSRSSTDLLEGGGGGGPGPSRGFSYSVPTTPSNARARRHNASFDAYLPLCEIQAGLKKGEFFEGTLRVNPRNYEDSFISAPGPGQKWDIYMGGLVDRNRALNGDLVAVRLHPSQRWKIHWDTIWDWERENGRTLLDPPMHFTFDENQRAQQILASCHSHDEVDCASPQKGNLEALEVIKEEPHRVTVKDEPHNSGSESSIDSSELCPSDMTCSDEEGLDDTSSWSVGWQNSAVDLSNIQTVISFNGLNNLNRQIESFMATEGERGRDDVIFAGEYEYVNLKPPVEEPLLIFTPQHIAPIGDDNADGTPTDVIGIMESEGGCVAPDLLSEDDEFNSDRESAESHGDLAESFHFASTVKLGGPVVQKDDSGLTKEDVRTMTFEKLEEMMRQKEENKKKDKRNTSSDEGVCSAIANDKKCDMGSSSATRAKPSKSDQEKSASKPRPRKKKVSGDNPCDPTTTCALVEFSEETSEHKETQDDERKSLGQKTKKKRNRKKKPGLIQRFNLTPEDLGFPSVIPDKENKPGVGDDLEGFEPATPEMMAKMGIIVGGGPGSPRKQRRKEVSMKVTGGGGMKHPAGGGASGGVGVGGAGGKGKGEVRSPQHHKKEERRKPDKVRGSPKHNAAQPSAKGVVPQTAPMTVPQHGAEGEGKYSLNQILGHEKWELFVQRTGRVVGVVEPRGSKVTAGYLKLFPDRNPTRALFSSTDSRFPRMWIPSQECPPNFFNRPADFSDTLFSAELLEWRDNAQMAQGRIKKIIGKTGDIEAETEAILDSQMIDHDEYDSSIFEGMDVTPEWKIPQDEFGRRRDFRKELVFTIDPKTARDLDDAISVKKLDEDLFEVGVHIADVSFFIKQGSELDIKASNRATSVYMVQKVVPMLPRLLCDNLCSLQPNSDKLTFSVVWKMNSNGDVVDEWFGRTIINSCCKLSYEHAQDLIDDPQKVWKDAELPEISGQRGIGEISFAVNVLSRMASEMRKRRFENGALRLDQIRVHFSLNENSTPLGFGVYEHSESHRLVEEFMLLANMAVAHRLYKFNPNLAFLRSHPEPDERQLKLVVSACAKLGITIDPKSAGSLQESLNYVALPSTDIEVLQKQENVTSLSREQLRGCLLNALTNMLSKPLKMAVYISSGQIQEPALFRHFALAIPLYTHFTSPIRRYADLVVHRLLAASLGYLEEMPYKTTEELDKIANRCNNRKYASKCAQESSVELFLWSFVRQIGTFEDDAVIVSVMDRAVDVISLKTGVIKRAYADRQGAKETIHDAALDTLTLVFNSRSKPGHRIEMPLKMFAIHKINMKCLKEVSKYVLTFVPPEDAVLVTQREDIQGRPAGIPNRAGK